MKRAVISALIIAALAATGLFLYADTKAAAADVTARLAELEKTPDLSAARELSKKWEDFCSRNIFLTNNECAFEISQVLVRITAGIETGEDTSDIREDCRIAEKLVAIYERSCAPTPENVF
ncbi:MAG: hypothetical protein IJU82_05055 [Ruminiclostridium sp.]|nr:hypothetical protein [Ruminiclostridium sp.]